jgi:carnosine N-methyltransferase
VIHHVLRPGGKWVHLGPLLWHWADAGPGELSLELPLDEVHRLAELVGFDPLRRCEFVDAAYIANARAMYKTVYQAAWWTMVKSSRPPLPRDDAGALAARLAAMQQQQRSGGGGGGEGGGLGGGGAAPPVSQPPPPPPREQQQQEDE